MIVRHLTLLALLPLGALIACGDDDKPGAADTAAPDTGITPDVADDAVEVTPDTEDTPDTTAEFSPRAKVHLVDPISTPDLVEVELEHLTSEDHSLVGDYARVRSCTPDIERGEKIPLDLGGLSLELTSCVPEHRAFPGEDGTYLHIAPPASTAEDDGRFAEVMMYHHMQVIHDYFKDVHGLTDRDQPLDALTNVQAHVSLCDQWAMIANAAFFPDGTIDELGQQFGIELDLGLDGDAIVFSGTDTRNFSYDAAVIYHEYTHAMLGATRLNAVFIDAQGLNNLPGALNEAYADYFAGTITGASAVGNYALNDLEGMSICGFQVGGGGNFARDMENLKTCPFDLTAEVHADSEIFSSALWEIRKELGATDADRVILSSVLTLTNTSDFSLAAVATIEAAGELLDEAARATVEAAFTSRGIVDCPRVLPVERVGERGLAVTLEGKDAFSPNPFPGWTPGYLQYGLTVPEGTTTVTIEVEVQTGGLGGLFGGGGGEPALELALKAGTTPVAYTLGNGPGSGSHDAELVMPVEGGKVVIGSAEQPAPAGPWTFAIHNRGGGAAVSKITATFE